MRVAKVDGLLTLFYDGSKLWNSLFYTEWRTAHSQNGRNSENWESWNLSDECKKYWRERYSWEQILVMEGVTEIPQYTFKLCKNVKRIVFANTVTRIGFEAMYRCISLSEIEWSINLEYIGMGAFMDCNLGTVFVPPRCREIEAFAFSDNDDLGIFSVPPQTILGHDVIFGSKIFADIPIEVKAEGEVANWLSNIHNEEKYKLHRACSSFCPLKEVLFAILKEQGIGIFNLKNKMGISPSRYLKENPYTDLNEKEIINDFIMKMVGEC